MLDSEDAALAAEARVAVWGTSVVVPPVGCAALRDEGRSLAAGPGRSPAAPPNSPWAVGDTEVYLIRGAS